MLLPADCPLTEGQFSVVKALVDGQTYEQAAAQMGRTPSTMRSQIGLACGTLNVHGALQCVVECVRKGWIEVRRSKLKPAAPAPIAPPDRKREFINLTPARTVYLMAVNLNACCVNDAERDLAKRLMHRLAGKVITEGRTHE